MLLLCAMVGGSSGALAALNLADPLPIGPQVTVGKLPNGLTYYLQKNSLPAKRLREAFGLPPAVPGNGTSRRRAS